MADQPFREHLLDSLTFAIGRLPKSLLQKRAEGHTGFWTRLSRSIMRHPVRYLVGATSLMVALFSRQPSRSD